MIKGKTILVWVVGFMPLLATLVLLPYMANQIPAHYGIDGQVTRYGSKYETLVFPLVTILVLAIIQLVEYIYHKVSQKKNLNEKAMFACKLSVALLFCGLSGVFLSFACMGTENIAFGIVDLLKVMGISFSVMWIIIGNVMPKTKQNPIIGIRTSWTLENETVWFKTHRLGGIMLVATGILSLVVGIILTALSQSRSRLAVLPS